MPDVSVESRQTAVLLIGYGNPGRQDDGLGPALAAAVERLKLPGVTVDADYQLTVEDAAAVARHEVAIFADADTAEAGPFYLRAVEPAGTLSFSTHSVSPAAVMGLARDLFGARTKGFVLGIRGYVFNEFEESLSEKALGNLAAAVRFIESALRSRVFEETPGGTAKPSVAVAAPVSEE